MTMVNQSETHYYKDGSKTLSVEEVLPEIFEVDKVFAKPPQVPILEIDIGECMLCENHRTLVMLMPPDEYLEEDEFLKIKRFLKT